MRDETWLKEEEARVRRVIKEGNENRRKAEVERKLEVVKVWFPLYFCYVTFCYARQGKTTCLFNKLGSTENRII